MQRRHLLKVAGLFSATLAVATGSLPLALGHRSHVTLTRLLVNPRTAKWELIHAIHYHDAAIALRRLTPGQGLAATEAKGQARLMLEVEREILWSSDAGALELEAVGAELSGDSVLLYQECLAPPAGSLVTVQSRLLQGVFPDQLNRFSIEHSGSPRLFTANAGTPRFQFMA